MITRFIGKHYGVCMHDQPLAKKRNQGWKSWKGVYRKFVEMASLQIIILHGLTANFYKKKKKTKQHGNGITRLAIRNFSPFHSQEDEGKEKGEEKKRKKGKKKKKQKAKNLLSHHLLSRVFRPYKP